jgi:Fe-S oxidoreductase
MLFYIIRIRSLYCRQASTKGLKVQCKIDGQGSTIARLQHQLQIHKEKCTDCKLCLSECVFLQKYGSPKKIAGEYQVNDSRYDLMPFECSLCGLCAAVCPAKINPATMFSAMRREMVRQGRVDNGKYRALLRYERIGTSRLFSHFSFPTACDTVFFPGCALAGSRAKVVLALFAHLQRTIPTLGIVLDCCTKPSLDLGREVFFQRMFGDIKKVLRQAGVSRILVACPSCYSVFKDYAKEFTVETVYQYLASTASLPRAKIEGVVTVHDPCSIRNEMQVQVSARQILQRMGLAVEEMAHHGALTFCCGEGGAVAFSNTDLARTWGKRRKAEAAGRRVIAYCAGCTEYLSSSTATSHLLDVIFQPNKVMAGKKGYAKFPWTYLHRLYLKYSFKQKLVSAATGKRASCRPPSAFI